MAQNGVERLIEIRPLQLHQVEAVRQVIIQICCEIWQVSEAEVHAQDDMSDLEDVESHYFKNRGTFLVLLEQGNVVGSGAVRCWSADICELKRMWLLKEYRGQGFGLSLAESLLEFARQSGYQKMRLDLRDAHRQAQALKFYQRLGFGFIERYNGSPCTVFMEKVL
jgi:putative acetyltransferase